MPARNAWCRTSRQIPRRVGVTGLGEYSGSSENVPFSVWLSTVSSGTAIFVADSCCVIELAREDRNDSDEWIENAKQRQQASQNPTSATPRLLVGCLASLYKVKTGQPHVP